MSDNETRYDSISSSPNRYHGPATYKKRGPNIGVNVKKSISPDTSPSRSSSVVQPTTQSRRRSRSHSRSPSRSLSPSDSHNFRRPKNFKKNKPNPLNLMNLELTAPDGRAAALRQEEMNQHMVSFGLNGNSEQIKNYDPNAPENFGDNEAFDFDEENIKRWREPIQTYWTNKLTGNGRRSYRKQTKKPANKHKHRRQTRRKTFRNRK